MVDENIVGTKLRQINGYTTDLAEMQGVSKDRYHSDVVIQRAVERTLMNLIQACIDLAEHIRATEDLGPAETSKEAIGALGKADIITDQTQRKLEEAVGFRNVLAHRYGNIDHDVVHEVLHEDLEWFERFQREIAQWFREQEP